MSTLVTKEAPDFTAQAVLPNNEISELTLSKMRGKYVVLFFYPLDFTFVCPSEIIAFDKKVEEFKKLFAYTSAELAFSYQGEALKKLVVPLAAELGSDFVAECDVTDEDSLDAVFKAL